MVTVIHSGHRETDWDATPAVPSARTPSVVVASDQGDSYDPAHLTTYQTAMRKQHTGRQN